MPGLLIIFLNGIGQCLDRGGALSIFAQLDKIRYTPNIPRRAQISSLPVNLPSRISELSSSANIFKLHLVGRTVKRSRYIYSKSGRALFLLEMKRSWVPRDNTRMSG